VDTEEDIEVTTKKVTKIIGLIPTFQGTPLPIPSTALATPAIIMDIKQLIALKTITHQPRISSVLAAEKMVTEQTVVRIHIIRLNNFRKDSRPTPHGYNANHQCPHTLPRNNHRLPIYQTKAYREKSHSDRYVARTVV
jgi:hypothetical protein